MVPLIVFDWYLRLAIRLDQNSRIREFTLDKCVFKLLRDFAVEEFLSYESLDARKEEYQRATSKRSTRFAVEFFLSYKSLKSRKRRIFLPTSYRQGQVRESQGSREVRQGWSIATRRGREKVMKRKSPQKGDVRRSRKRKEKLKTKEGKKVDPGGCGKADVFIKNW